MFDNKKTIIAILPLRKGSQRIKNKNFKKLNKKPLCYWIIKNLKKSKKIKKVIISTDYAFSKFKGLVDDKIILHARPKKLSNNCSMNLVIKDVLEKFNFDNFIQVHATSPNLNYRTLDKAINFYFKNYRKYDSIFSVTPIKKRLWSKNLMPINHNPSENPTTQNLKTILEENSAFYIFTRKSFYLSDNRIGIKPKAFPLSLEESFDIDTKEEFKLLEKIKR